MVTYQLTSAIVGLAMAAIIIWLVRRDLLHGKFAPWWFLAAIAFAVMGIAPRTIDHVAMYLGVSYPPILAVILGIAFLVLKVIVMDVERSKNVTQLQRLTQRLALLQGQLESQGVIAPIEPEKIGVAKANSYKAATAAGKNSDKDEAGKTS